ncbi:hypothetical protein SLS60_006341 [Paraconiothyrium brasiliense]|uniref:Uncharacterized protein n=1 Tax=Paraconiothyrium brasiliense TaxID=300254 RepID=A0ABR3RAW0_9PLEO
MAVLNLKIVKFPTTTTTMSDQTFKKQADLVKADVQDQGADAADDGNHEDAQAGEDKDHEAGFLFCGMHVVPIEASELKGPSFEITEAQEKAIYAASEWLYDQEEEEAAMADMDGDSEDEESDEDDETDEDEEDGVHEMDEDDNEEED